MAKNINKDMLTHAIVEKTDLSKRDVSAVIEAFVDVVTAELRAGNKVTVTGSKISPLPSCTICETGNPRTWAEN